MAQVYKMTPPFLIRPVETLHFATLNKKKKKIIPPWLITKPKIYDALCILPEKSLTYPGALKEYVLEYLQKHEN